jgi:osmoprotectant transport system substrate-binding protein
MKKIFLVATLCVVCLLNVTACGENGNTSNSTKSSQSTQTKPVVVIGSLMFTENTIVAEIYAQALENAGVPVQRRLRSGRTPALHQELLSATLSLYPEYTGTALSIVLQQPKTTNNPKTIYEQVKIEYNNRYNLQWLNPAPMNNGYAFALKRENAERLKLKTLSDFAQQAERFTLIAPAQWNNSRSGTDGLANLQRTYGGFRFKQVLLVLEAERYKTFNSADDQAVLTFTTDGEIAGNNLALLEDDKQFFPIYQVAPVIRQDILKAYPQIKDILDAVSARLTTSAITSMNWRVDGPSQQTIEAVARNFLVLEGLIK